MKRLFLTEEEIKQRQSKAKQDIIRVKAGIKDHQKGIKNKSLKKKKKG